MCAVTCYLAISAIYLSFPNTLPWPADIASYHEWSGAAVANSIKMTGCMRYHLTFM